MNRLSKITSQYVASEDRISLAGHVEGGDPLRMWVTQRLLHQLLPVLLTWLHEGAKAQTSDPVHAEVLQGFAQQAARARLEPQAPVQVSTHSASWLVMKVDVGHKKQSLVLTFRDRETATEGGHDATLELSAASLRQWLGVLHDLCVKAQWPLQVWPAWLQESAAASPPRSAPLH